jgi:hypothetical protein
MLGGSALVLAVEAVEASHFTSPTVTSGLTAAARSIERSALIGAVRSRNACHHSPVRRRRLSTDG